MSAGYYSIEPRCGESFSVLPDDWRRVVALARFAGWRDHTAARELLFAGDGIEDDVGELTEAQAFRLGDALRRALDDIPNHDTQSHKLRACPWAGPNAQQGWLEEDPLQTLSLLERFSGEDKELVLEMVALCGRGGFRVAWERW
jgi:hypothetical protein